MNTVEMRLLESTDPIFNGIRFSESITITERYGNLYINGRIYYKGQYERIRKSTNKKATLSNRKWVEKNKQTLLWELSNFKKEIDKRRENNEQKKSIPFIKIAERTLQTKFNVSDTEYGINEFTKKEYKYIYEKRIKPFFKDYYTADIDIEVVEDWQNWILTKQYDKGLSNYKNEKKEFLSIKSLKNIRIVLNMIFDDCVQKNHMKKNLLEIVKVPKKNKKSVKEITYLTIDNIKKVINSFDSYIAQTNKDYEIKGRKQFKNVFLTMIGSGMRSGELIGLKWEDIDFQNETVFIQRRIREGNIDLPKSSSSIRKFTLIKEAIDALKEQKELFKNEHSEWVFLNRYNKPFKSPQQFDIRYKEILTISGLKADRFYSLRHTYATNMIRNGFEHFVTVSGILGHKDSVVTQKRYVSNDINTDGLKGKSLFG